MRSKRGDTHALDKHKHFAKNPYLQTRYLFKVNGSHQAHTLINHIGNMALSSLSCGTCIQPDFHDHE